MPPIAALPLEEVEAPEPRGFARRMGNSFVDAANAPRFKEDDVAFRSDSVGIALQDERSFGHLVNRLDQLRIVVVASQ